MISGERDSGCVETWNDSATGMDCEIRECRFSPTHYHLCGYVRVPATNPFYGFDYSAEPPESIKALKDWLMQQPQGKRGYIDLFCMAGRDPHAGDYFDVHGSITYSRWHKDGTFWYGFDCGHCDDTPEVQNAAYVHAECESLARQLAAFKSMTD